MKASFVNLTHVKTMSNHQRSSLARLSDYAHLHFDISSVHSKFLNDSWNLFLLWRSLTFKPKHRSSSWNRYGHVCSISRLIDGRKDGGRWWRCCFLGWTLKVWNAKEWTEFHFSLKTRCQTQRLLNNKHPIWLWSFFSLLVFENSNFENVNLIN